MGTGGHDAGMATIQDQWRGAEVGTLSTFSFLPAVEFRPTRDLMRNTVGFEWLFPYASLGAGVNVHSFSNGAELGNESISFPNTFALRVAGVSLPHHIESGGQY